MEKNTEETLAHIQEARGIIMQDIVLKSRELSIAVTKLDEAEMWLLRHAHLSEPTKNDSNG